MNRRLSDQFQLRLPGGMRERLKDVADANDRSMNAEIVARLEESLTPHDKAGDLAIISKLTEELSIEKRRIERLQNINQGLIVAQQEISGEFQRVWKELRRVYPLSSEEVDEAEDVSK